MDSLVDRINRRGGSVRAFAHAQVRSLDDTFDVAFSCRVDRNRLSKKGCKFANVSYDIAACCWVALSSIEVSATPTLISGLPG